MATLHDIARRAGVSIATVSNVLNDTSYVGPEVRARVLEAVEELNYRPNSVARSLRLKRTLTVGMLVPDVTDPFFPAVVRGAEDVLARAGYTVVIGNSDNDSKKEEQYYQTFLDRQVDGILTVPTRDEAPEIIRRLEKQRYPVVYVDRCHSGTASDSVMVDDLAGSQECVEHLLGSGLRRIAIITGPSHLANVRARLEGYRRALRKMSFSEDHELIREGTFDRVSGLLRTQELLRLESKPDAIFVTNGLMACGALEAIQDANLLCPADVALASFDRLDFFDLLRPRLTGMVAHPYDLGARAAELLLNRISGKSTGPGRHYTLPVQLVARESTTGAKSSQKAARARTIRKTTR